MSYVGFGLRNAVGVGIGGVSSLIDAARSTPTPPPPVIDNALLQENGDYLLQENGDYILLESA